MSLVILDMGSGNTCGNSTEYARRMVDTVIAMDKKRHEVVFKWQLEKDDPPGQKKLGQGVFKDVHQYTIRKGYKSGSSVFDIESLLFLMSLQPSFIKIACRPDLYYLTGIVPRSIPVYLSSNPANGNKECFGPVNILLCIPEYPAKLEDYEKAGWCKGAISDHTPGLKLWRKYQPQVWEKHFVLERSKDNPDSGVFAITPDELEEVIG